MNKILVTGSNGQLGSELKFLSNSRKDFEFLFTDSKKLDVTDFNALDFFFKSHQPIDVIVNCAAYTNVERAEVDIESANLVNNLAVKNLARIAKLNDTKLIHISTDFVFDGLKKRGAYNEEDETNPINIYGRTKLEGEKQILLERPRNSIIIRTSWLYSRFGHNFPKKIIELSRKKTTLEIVCDNVGNPTSARDLAGAILEIIPKINNEIPEIFHYSNLGECSWYDFAQEILKQRSINIKVVPVSYANYKQNALRPARSVMSKKKIINQFNLKILNWKESLKTINLN